MSEHWVPVKRKISHLTARNLQQNHTQGGTAISCDWLEMREKRDDREKQDNRQIKGERESQNAITGND